MKDFMTGVVFELEKDSPFQGKREFMFKIYRKYGFKPDSELYRMIVNYQIEKYGGTFSLATKRDYVSRFGTRTPARRRKVKENNYRHAQEDKVVNRNDILFY